MTKTEGMRIRFLNLLREMRNAEIIIPLLAAAAMNLSYLMKIRDVLEPSETISVLTPFLLILCAPQLIPSPHFFMSAFTFFILSNHLNTNQMLYYRTIRTTRMKWIVSEILRIMVISFLVILFLFVCSVMAMIPKISLSVPWDYELPFWMDALEGSWIGNIPYAIVYQLSQAEAFVYALGFWWLYSVFGGLFLLTFRLLIPKVQGIGLGLLFVMYFFDYICEYCLPYSFRYASPVALSRLSYMNWGYDRIYPSPEYAICFFLICSLVLFVTDLLLARNVGFDMLTERT